MTIRGVMFVVVGPSGVGKDTLIDAARPRLGGPFSFARRTVTRPSDAGGEDHEAMSTPSFEELERAGGFAVVWRAHGLAYGIRHAELKPLDAGTNVIVNGSRRALGAFAAAARPAVVLSIMAQPATVAARLAARGREDARQVAARLARDAAIVTDLPVFAIDNDGPLAESVRAFVHAIESAATHTLLVAEAPVTRPGLALCVLGAGEPPVRSGALAGASRVEVETDRGRTRATLLVGEAGGGMSAGTVGLSPEARLACGVAIGDRAVVRPAGRPASRDALRAKVAGKTLSAREIAALVRDLAEDRYAPEEVAGFLVAAQRNLTDDEVIALTRARAEFVTPLAFDVDLVADKHSLGGVPGGRLTLVTIPIVAAHGLLVPKTSSRAITSAAGTADVVECVARVELSRADLHRAVVEAGAVMAWSGRISHSRLDDVMNAISRPLGIRSAGLDVSSILSKKLAVGATHVLLDLPVGPRAKVRNDAEVGAIERLFAVVGRAVGLTVTCVPRRADEPIGRGIGPALEMADALSVLANRPNAPHALRERAIDAAGTMIEWDRTVQPGAGRARAASLLASGAAWDAFDRIVSAQGRHEEARIGSATRPILAERAGTLAAVDGFAIAGIARAAGAPSDKGAGVHLEASIGDEVLAGQPLGRIHASSAAPLQTIAIPPSAFLVA